MALVDYSSSTDPEDEEAPPPVAAKRQRTSHDDASPREATLPPLPAAFHNLYASTVRVSTSDDPTLHQGRKRVNPHKVGSWPSHLFIEWHPTTTQHALLSKLLAALRPALSVPLESFLTSDLGAPQPLHVSLSRPVVFSTGQKDGFLEQLVGRIGSCGISPFDLALRGLEWHWTSESGRSFLVLRVGSGSGSGNADVTGFVSPISSPPPGISTSASASTLKGSSTATEQRHNPELSGLLRRCNALVEEYKQPPLYAFKDNDGDDAFHISIAWSFAEPTSEVGRQTEGVFCQAGMREEILAMRVPVDGVKAKIGNVVTHIPLPARGKRGRDE
ncbi:U6 snRNA phosphodiesterase Usb1 [Hypoxylon sp. FL1150]|nr:U6 snRNA phosphodiesterase Usb1 [Hypoxylon sp. FL1150]